MPRTTAADRPDEKRCTYVRDDGSRCGAYKLHEKDVCQAHSMSPEDFKAQARRGGFGRHRLAEERKQLEDDLWQRYTHPAWQPAMLEAAIKVIRELLSARFDYLNTPDWSARALGVWLGLRLFRPTLEQEASLDDPPADLLEALERLGLQGVDPEVFGLAVPRVS